MNSEIDDDKIIYMTLCVIQELEIKYDIYVDQLSLMQILEGSCADDDDNLDVWNKLTCYGCLSNFDFFKFGRISRKILDNEYATLFCEKGNVDDVFKCTQKGIKFSSRYEYNNSLMDCDVIWNDNNKCSCNNNNISHCNDKNSEFCDLAKEQIIKWFIDGEHNNEQINYNCLSFAETVDDDIGYVNTNFSFKKEKIFINYPIVECDKYNSVQNIWSDKYKKKESSRDKNGLCSPSPNMELCIKNGLVPKYWFDVAMSQNGKLVCGIIILDKHKIDSNIGSMIYNTIMNNNPNDDIFVIAMNANWILKHKHKPEKLLIYCSFYCRGKIYDDYKLFVLHEPFKNTQAIKKMIAYSNEEKNKIIDDEVDRADAIQVSKPEKYKKKTIPKPLRKLVWNTYVGEKKGEGGCYVCAESITPFKYECGHIIAESKGGVTQIHNLRPVCSDCNKSVGAQNMDEYKNKYFKLTTSH